MPPKISLAELYTLKDKKELSKYITFDNIINMKYILQNLFG